MKADKTQTPSAEDQRRAGHREILGETYAKFEFFENGWNPYTRFLDVDKVDIILRRRHQNRPIYREVQVKYGKLWQLKPQGWEGVFDYSSWRFFHEEEFKAYLDNPDFYVVLILAADTGYKGDLFIFPVRDFYRLVKSAFLSGGKRKVIICRSRSDETKWYLRRVSKISEITPDSTVDISKFRRNFSLLNPI
jgi:hypothetical protein